MFERLYLQRWEADWAAMLSDRRQPLEQRLIAFYNGFLDRMSDRSLRLFLRANLDGLDLAKRYSFPLTERILGPVIDECRHELDIPAHFDRPLLREELDLALVLHGGLVFTRIRKFVYHAAVREDVATLTTMHVRAFLPGALAQIAELHGK